jgi:hypothetical protein
MKIRILAAAALAAAVPVTALAGPTAMHPGLSAKLAGKSEVPAASMAGHGIVNLTLDSKKGTVCWTFDGVTGIGKATAAHIHKARAGTSGPVVVPFGGSYKAKGCTTNGAIRGQLVAGMMHM